MKEIIETIKMQLPESSIRINAILEELLKEIEFVVENFISVGYLPDELDYIYNELEKISKELSLGYGQLNLLEDIQYHVNQDDGRPNYEDYLVDNTIEHSLLENFTHMRPYGFTFLNNTLNNTIEAENWKEFYVKACEMFYGLDPDIFLTFANKTHMNGKSRDYFSKYKNNVQGPVKISDNIYISTDFGANDFRDLLIKIIKEYNYNVKKFKVYLRADYNPLHITRYY